MRKSLTSVLFGAAMAIGAVPTVAGAAPLAGQMLAQRVFNAEFRGATRTSRGFENQIWQFLPGGRVHAVGDSRRQVWNGQDFHQEWQDDGTWHVAGDRLCVAFETVNHNLNACYIVDVRYGRHVRLVGPHVWEGTLEPRE
jgi:hypothetical protein